MKIYELILKLVFCHLIGDYVLQNDFIASSKGSNWYHLFVHVMLYGVPFYICFGLNIYLVLNLITHFIIDALKARYNLISYTMDQIYHYLIIIGLYTLWFKNGV